VTHIQYPNQFGSRLWGPKRMGQPPGQGYQLIESEDSPVFRHFIVTDENTVRLTRTHRIALVITALIGLVNLAIFAACVVAARDTKS
jgi:hypothetical protein